MAIDTGRRTALLGFGSLALGATALAGSPVGAATSERLVPQGASVLSQLAARLQTAPRRRDSKALPMIDSHPDFWDDTALKDAIAHPRAPTHVCRSANLPGTRHHPMRNGL